MSTNVIPAMPRWLSCGLEIYVPVMAALMAAGTYLLLVPMVTVRGERAKKRYAARSISVRHQVPELFAVIDDNRVASLTNELRVWLRIFRLANLLRSTT